MKRPSRFAQALLPAAAALLLSCSAASAQEQLGSEGNLLLKNPYADATDKLFGRGLAAGDFDGDGTGDLAVSENSGTRMRILLGQNWAVGATGVVIKFFASTVNLPAHSYTMASGDFDGDGRDEVAVDTTSGGPLNSGGVYILDRATNGTWSVQAEIRAGGAYPGAPQASARLGSSMAVGDFNDDGYDDLALGLRGQIVSGLDNAGAVMITYGGAGGISATGARLINRNSDGLTFAPREDDYYGWALAAGDFDGDGADDLAVGVPNATCPDGSWRGGGVVVLRGSAANGITNAQSRIWRPGVLGVAGDCNNTANFGQTLATGRFDFNTYADLAIGAPVGGSTPSAVHVLYGTPDGLDANGNQRIAAPAVPGDNDSRFGNTLATGRLAHRCSGIICRGDSLVISAPFTLVNGVSRAGTVWLVNAAFGGPLDPAGMRAIAPLSPLDIAAPQDNAQFGNALAIADFNGDARADLAIGAYLYDDGASVDEGAVQVVYQSEYLFADSFD